MILKRSGYTPKGIFGSLSQDDGTHVAFTLEHSYNNLPKVPTGTYACVRGDHMLHSGPIETFEITGVPGHSGILFHYGNVNADSDGCVLLGSSVSGVSLLASREAFSKFMEGLVGVNNFTLKIYG